MAAIEDEKGHVFYGDYVDTFTSTVPVDDKPLTLDVLIEALDKLEPIGSRRALAIKVLDAMLADMPLLRLQERWAERKGSVPAYVEKVMGDDAPPRPLYHTLVELAEKQKADGTLPHDSFSTIARLLRARIEAELQRLFTYGHPCLLPLRAELYMVPDTHISDESRMMHHLMYQWLTPPIHLLQEYRAVVVATTAEGG